MYKRDGLVRVALVLVFVSTFSSAGLTQVQAPGLSGRWLINPGWTRQAPDVHTAVLFPAGAWGDPLFGLYLQAEKLAWSGAPRVFQSGILLPAGPGMFTGSLQLSGAEGYSQLESAIGYARPLGGWIRVGLRIGILSAHPAGYPGWRILRADGGMQLRLHQDWLADLACWNLLQQEMGRSLPTAMPRVIRSGLSWVPADHWALSVAAILEDGYAATLTVAFRYRFQERLTLQCWYVSTQLGLGMGLEYRHPAIQARLAFGYVYPLGMTALPGIQYIRPRKP